MSNHCRQRRFQPILTNPYGIAHHDSRHPPYLSFLLGVVNIFRGVSSSTPQGRCCGPISSSSLPKRTQSFPTKKGNRLQEHPLPKFDYSTSASATSFARSGSNALPSLHATSVFCISKVQHAFFRVKSHRRRPASRSISCIEFFCLAARFPPRWPSIDVASARSW